MTYRGNNIDIGKGTSGLSSGTVVENKEACAKLSFSTKGAKFWSYLPAKKLCWVKTSKKGRRQHDTAVSGNRACGKPGNQILTFKCVVTLVSYKQQDKVNYAVSEREDRVTDVTPLTRMTAVLGYNWAVLSSNRLYCAVLSCTGLYWAALGYIVGCNGLQYAVLHYT